MRIYYYFFFIILTFLMKMMDKFIRGHNPYINRSENKMEKKKLDILKDLIIDEEYTLEDLKRLVEKSKSFIKIESKSGKVIISPEFAFTTREKIVIFLIGFHFSKELGLNQDVQITSSYMSENIEVAQTTLSGPLGDIVKNKIVAKEDNTYAIKFYEIENQLNLLIEKYFPTKISNLNLISKKKKPITKKNTNVRKKKAESSEKAIKSINEELLITAMAPHNFTIDNLYSVVNIVNNKMILLRGWKGASNQESQVRGTLIILTINKLFYGLDEINSSELRECLSGAGLQITNLSTTLKNYSKYIIHMRGPIGSTNTSYRITRLGFQKGIILLKDIIEITSNFDLVFKSRITKEISDKISIDEDKLDQNINSFANDNDLDEERLRTLFEFQKEGIRICSPLKDNIRKSLQIKTLMLLGVLLKEVYDVNNFSGKVLLKGSRTSNERLDLLDSNKSYIKYFSGNKPKSAMQLTYAGEKKAIEMLKSYIEKEDCQL